MKGKSGKLLVKNKNDSSDSEEIDESNLRDFTRKSVNMIKKKRESELKLSEIKS